tara:strand:+ start:469 stop:624 length:156 start_codon:yes stop_codon:yes gene_type:complete
MARTQTAFKEWFLANGYIAPKNTVVKKFVRVLTDFPKGFCIPKNQITKNIK